MELGKSPVKEKVARGLEYDAWDLVSKNENGQTTRMEAVYAQYSNDMKELARQARALARNSEDIKYDPAARERYKDEYNKLKSAISLAEKNSPLERQAQLIANTKFAAIRYNNPDLDKEHLKREKGKQLDYARKAVGAKKLLIGTKDNPLTDRMWEAISAGAITPTMLKRVLLNADMGRVRELAMPKTKSGISESKVSMAKRMMKNGYTQAEVARMLDVSIGKLQYAIGLENM